MREMQSPSTKLASTGIACTHELIIRQFSTAIIPKCTCTLRHEKVRDLQSVMMMLSDPLNVTVPLDGITPKGTSTFERIQERYILTCSAADCRMPFLSAAANAQVRGVKYTFELLNRELSPCSRNPSQSAVWKAPFREHFERNSRLLLRGKAWRATFLDNAADRDRYRETSDDVGH